MNLDKRSIRNLVYDAWHGLKKLSTIKKMVLIFSVWALIFLPTSLFYARQHASNQLAYYPEEAAPIDTVHGDWTVETDPLPLNSTAQGRFRLSVERGEQVNFSWKADDYTAQVHIGRVNVHFESSWGSEGVIRLRRASNSSREVIEWRGNKTFDREGQISYYYRLDKGDIPRFDRRARAILKGENLYESVRTGPPPLINFFFIPPVVLTPSVEFGGLYLSFYLYFSLFMLLNSLLLFLSLKKLGEGKAVLSSILLLANPISIYTIFQDEGIVAFTVILSIFFISRGRKKIASGVIGTGLITKIWSGFLLPSQLFYKVGKKEKGLYILISILTAGSFLLFFYTLWGSDVLWFIKFYGGTASKSTVGGVSIWARLSRFDSIPPGFIDSTILISVIVVLEVSVLYLGHKRDLGPLAVFTALISFFLVLYPKVHWEYYLILYPTMVFYSVRDKRFLSIFLINIVSLSISRGLRNLSAYPRFDLLILSLISSLIASISILWMVYLILTDGSVPRFRFLYEKGIGSKRGDHLDG